MTTNYIIYYIMHYPRYLHEEPFMILSKLFITFQRQNINHFFFNGWQLCFKSILLILSKNDLAFLWKPLFLFLTNPVLKTRKNYNYVSDNAPRWDACSWGVSKPAPAPIQENSLVSTLSWKEKSSTSVNLVIYFLFSNSATVSVTYMFVKGSRSTI